MAKELVRRWAQVYEERRACVKMEKKVSRISESGCARIAGAGGGRGQGVVQCRGQSNKWSILTSHNVHNTKFLGPQCTHPHSHSILCICVLISLIRPSSIHRAHTFRLEAHQKWSVHPPTDPEVPIIHPGSHFHSSQSRPEGCSRPFLLPTAQFTTSANSIGASFSLAA